MLCFLSSNFPSRYAAHVSRQLLSCLNCYPVCRDVAYRIATRRVNLKPRFQDYDTLRHYTVPKNRFQGVLQTEGLVRLPLNG